MDLKVDATRPSLKHEVLNAGTHRLTGLGSSLRGFPGGLPWLLFEWNDPAAAQSWRAAIPHLECVLHCVMGLKIRSFLQTGPRFSGSQCCSVRRGSAMCPEEGEVPSATSRHRRSTQQTLSRTRANSRSCFARMHSPELLSLQQERRKDYQHGKARCLAT